MTRLKPPKYNKEKKLNIFIFKEKHEGVQLLYTILIEM